MKNSLHPSEFSSEIPSGKLKSKIASLRSHTSAVVLGALIASAPAASAEDASNENFYNYEGATMFRPIFGFMVELGEKNACDAILEGKIDDNAAKENAQVQKDYSTCTELNDKYMTFLKEQKEDLDAINLAKQNEELKNALNEHPHVAGVTK
jgi:hypothetical protein